MEFQLTKLMGGMLMPLSIILIILIIALSLLMLTRKRRTGLFALIAASILLLTLSVPPLSQRALLTLEQTYPVLENPPHAQWIIVLGGGSKGKDNWPPATRLGESSLYRIAEGVRLAKLLPDARIITSGGCGNEDISTAHLMKQTAVSWGIDPERIIVHSTPQNTAQEALEVTSIVKEDDVIILVTSAFHMQRAMALFQGQGISAVPAPTGHLIDPDPQNRHIGHFLPSSSNLKYAEMLLWEKIGLSWAGLRGQI
ncbi:MAG: YdcF family protein [Desulfonatronovibrio sp.]